MAQKSKTAFLTESGSPDHYSLITDYCSLLHHRPKLTTAGSAEQPVNQHAAFVAVLADLARHHLHRLFAEVGELRGDHGAFVKRHHRHGVGDVLLVAGRSLRQRSGIPHVRCTLCWAVLLLSVSRAFLIYCSASAHQQSYISRDMPA